ncbi:MAG TPA: LCP family protein [Bacilli bacterium]
MICLAGAGYAGYLYLKFDNALENAKLPGTPAEVPKPEAAAHKPITILLLGLDTRAQTGTLNTDVIMTATFNPQTKSATIVSIPRDTYFQPEGYRARKINAFYSVAVRADKEHAPEQMKTWIGDFLGVTIDYVAIVDFKTFEDVIDAFGGIDVDVDMDMRYVDHADGTDINLRKGFQHLNGEQALDFVRYRKSNMGTGPSSDFDRNRRQQQVLAAIVGKLKSIGGVLKLGEIFTAIGSNIKTDMPKKQVQNFLKTYIGIKNDHIRYIPLDGKWVSPYTELNPETLNMAKSALQEELRGEDGNIAPEETEPPATAD